MLIVFLCENELFQRGWEVFVILVEIPEGWGGPSVPCKNGKSMEVGGGGFKVKSLCGGGLDIFWNYTMVF